MAGEQPQALCGSSGAAGGAAGEEAQPKSTRSMEGSATCTPSHLQRPRGRAGRPGDRADPLGELGPRKGKQPWARPSPVPMGWQQRRGAQLRRGAPGAQLTGALLNREGWKKRNLSSLLLRGSWQQWGHQGRPSPARATGQMGKAQFPSIPHRPLEALREHLKNSPQHPPVHKRRGRS